MRVAGLFIILIVAGFRAETASSVKSEPIGSGRCQGCHGTLNVDVLTKPLTDATWKSSAMIFDTLDPHRKAWSALTNDLGQKIIKRLGYDAKKVAERCAGCHTNPTLANTDSQLRIEGVSCEACHGDASGWEAPHTAWTKGEPKPGYGFTDLRSPAATCAGCHVGAPGTPLRDMNHDMIAAGHPKLGDGFEKLFARMPPHWRPGMYRMREEEFCQACVDLLKDRQRRKDPWPELAEANCRKCHHNLK